MKKKKRYFIWTEMIIRMSLLFNGAGPAFAIICGDSVMAFWWLCQRDDFIKNPERSIDGGHFFIEYILIRMFA